MSVMRRSSMGWRGRLTDSKSSFHLAPRAAESTAPLLLTAVPDRRRRLSEGILIEASVLARLLGIRLLKLHATVMLMPADVAARPAPGDPPALERARASLPPTRLYPAGRGLAEAIRHINEGEELLAEARHNGALARADPEA
jgi:hypothetical protein